MHLAHTIERIVSGSGVLHLLLRGLGQAVLVLPSPDH